MESRLSPESENILHVESGILGFGIRTTVQGIRNPNDDWKPESKFH